MGFARNSVRGFLYADLISIINKPAPRLAGEQDIVEAYAEAVRLKRLDAAEFALSEFHRWEVNVCANFGTGYQPPLGFTYPSQSGACTFGPVTGVLPLPPTSAEFIAYGTAHAYNKLNTDAQTAAIAVDTGRAIGFGAVLVAAGALGATVAFFIAMTAFGATIISAIAPFLLIPITYTTGVAAGTTIFGSGLISGAIAIGGAVAVVIAAIAIAVLQGIAVSEAAAIPSTLQAQVQAAQVAPDLRASIATKEGQQELYSVFIESTMPDFASTSAPPAPIASDRRFRVKDESRQNLGVFPNIDFQSPALPGTNWEARLSGGWFVPKHVTDADITIETLSLYMPYFNWEGEKRIAWRRGNQFVVTKPDATTPPDAAAAADLVRDEIQYKDWDGTKLIASIAVDETPPVVTPNVIGTAGNEGWYRSNVSLTWDIEEEESAISSERGCDPLSITSSGTTATSCTATSEGGTGSGSVTIKTDLTLPSIEGSRTPGANGNGWNNSAVTVSFICSDTPSGVASCTGPQTLSSEGANQSATGSATDVAGNTASATVSGISIDKTQPTATASRAPAANGNGWNNTDVAVSFSGTDAGGSGIAACTAPITLSEGANQSAAGTCTDQAGNASAPAAANDINVDKTNPAVAVTGVTGGATYTFGAVPAAGCSTSDALSGVQTSAVVNVTGGTSNGVGSFTASCTGASDKAGNPGATSATYQVHYPFSDFLSPVDKPPTSNKVKAGAAVPVKFSLGGDFGLDILAAGSPTSQGIACDASATIDDIEQTVTAAGSSLSYDAASGQYKYVWKTQSSWAGTCRQLLVTLDDGSVHKANFKFK